MVVWIILLASSAAIGCLCARLIKEENVSFLAAALLPVLAFLFCLLFDTYVLPYRGGGASMWPIALMVGSPPAAISGIVGWMLCLGRKAK